MLEKSSKILQAVINRSKHFNWDEHKNTSVFTMQRPKVGLLDRLFKKNRAKGKQNKGMGNKTSYISI